MMQARHDDHLEAHEFSKRLGAISPAQFQAALDHFGLGHLVSAEPITLGNFGQNCFLHSTAGPFVLRGAPHYPWQFLEEQLLPGCCTSTRPCRFRGPITWTNRQRFSAGPTPSCPACQAGPWLTKRFAAAWTRQRNGISPGHSDIRWPISRYWNGRCPAPTIQ